MQPMESREVRASWSSESQRRSWTPSNRIWIPPVAVRGAVAPQGAQDSEASRTAARAGLPDLAVTMFETDSSLSADLKGFVAVRDSSNLLLQEQASEPFSVQPAAPGSSPADRRLRSTPQRSRLRHDSDLRRLLLRTR